MDVPGLQEHTDEGGSVLQAVFMDTPHLASGISLASFGWNHVWF